MELRDIVSGKKKEERFRTEEEVEVADVENRQLKFVEEEEDNFVFENEDEDRVELPKEFFGSKSAFFKGKQAVNLKW
ncbi:hypothetical protein M1146_00205 [Patescibacteria group bacterium]|nr:hypothetical protein [Patescibacteria group bacterium]